MRMRKFVLGILILGCSAGLLPLATYGDADTEKPAPAETATFDPSVYAKLSPRGKRSIERGTKWLMSIMRPKGMFGPDFGQPSDLSSTAIVGLVLVSQGNTPQHGPHSKELARVLDGVLRLADSIPKSNRRYDETTLIQRKIGINADRFLAALFLSQVLGESGDADEEVRRALERLVADICREQGKDGTWGDESWAPVLGTVLGWESLRAATSCGLTVEGSATLAGEALRANLKKSMSKTDGWMHDFYKNASSIRVLSSLGYRKDPIFRECVDRTLKFAQEDDRPFRLAGGEEYLAFFLVTECFLQRPDARWQSWYPIVSEKIIDQQNADGSWMGHHCITDRTFCTAAALLMLQSVHYSLPISDI
jgi:hypothetical protein